MDQARFGLSCLELSSPQGSVTLYAAQPEREPDPLMVFSTVAPPFVIDCLGRWGGWFQATVARIWR